MNKLKIAILVLPWIPIPPPGYAGTERIVYYLTEGLVKKGHEVTLFSIGESKTSAKLEFIINKPFGLQDDVMKTSKSSFYPLMHVAHCFEMQDQFDIIHSHAQFLALPFAAIAKTPSLHTFHRIFEFNTLDEKDLVQKYNWLNFTSISNSQRIPNINFIKTIYNGVDTNYYKPINNPKRDYIFWAGRLIDKKGPCEAIEVAKRLQYPLIMAGKITEKDFYEKNILHNIDQKLITLYEDLEPNKIIELFQNAKVTLVPTKWNEPFGLIPVESMSCGTPVITYENGGVKETIINNKTGYLVSEAQGIDGLAKITQHLLNLDHNKYQQIVNDCQQHVVDHFTIERMVDEYEKIYYQVINKA